MSLRIVTDAARTAIGAVLGELCEDVSKKLHDVNVIWDRIGGSKYLTRHYLLGRRSEAAPQPGGAHRESDRLGWKTHHCRLCLTPGRRFTAPCKKNPDGLHTPVEGEPPIVKPRSWNMFLHHFHRGDDAHVLHSHPWKWALSVILSTGYREERRVGDRVESKLCLPLSINFIRADDYHRVDLLGPDAWTLFIAGPHVEGDVWYFWDRNTGMRSRWDLYVAWVRGKRADACWEREPPRRAA